MKRADVPASVLEEALNMLSSTIMVQHVTIDNHGTLMTSQCWSCGAKYDPPRRMRHTSKCDYDRVRNILRKALGQ